MPIGKVKDVLPDPVLTQLAVTLGVGGDYVADRVAPVALVPKDHFKYAIWGREDIKDDVKTSRAPGVGASEVELAKTYTDGAVVSHSLKSKIPDEVRNNDLSPDTMYSREVAVLTSKLRLGIERRIAALLGAASNTRSAPSTKWDASGAKIRADILAAREVFRRNAGFLPNVMVVPPAVKAVLFNDGDILDLLRYTDGSLLANGMIPQIENMQVVSPGTIIDTANPGAAASVADVYASDEVYYLFVEPNAGNNLQAQTALRQVRSMASTGTPFGAFQWRDPDQSAHTDWVSVEVNQIEIVVSQAMILRQLDVLT